MEKKNNLDQLPIAALNNEQLAELQRTEERLNQEGSNVYLIAFQKNNQ